MLIFLLILMFLMLQDIHEQHVSLIPAILLYIWTCMHTSAFMYVLILYVPFVYFTYQYIHFIGEGDLLILAPLIYMIQLSQIPLFITLLGCFNLLTHYVYQSKTIPMLPSIIIAWLFAI